MDFICEKCDNSHDGSFGTGRFCSRGCANSRVRTTETKEKISLGVINHRKNGGNKGGYTNMTPEEFDLVIIKKREDADRKLLEEEFSKISEFSIKKRISLEQNDKCNHCGLNEWQGNPIPLELEHIDGNHFNNERINLECLCPNCHALTDTWRGRNKSKRVKKKVSDEAVCRAFLECDNIRQTLIKLNLAPKGSNYGRVKRCLTQANIKYE